MAIHDEARIQEEIDTISENIDAIMKKIDAAMPRDPEGFSKDPPPSTSGNKNVTEDRAD